MIGYQVIVSEDEKNPYHGKPDSTIYRKQNAAWRKVNSLLNQMFLRVEYGYIHDLKVSIDPRFRSVSAQWCEPNSQTKTMCIVIAERTII